MKILIRTEQGSTEFLDAYQVKQIVAKPGSSQIIYQQI